MAKLLNVIKFEGSNDVLIAKESIACNSNSLSIEVKDSQEAILVKSGKALNSYTSGMHIIDICDLFSIKKVLLPLRKKELLTVDVFFVNLSTHLGIKWGTDSKIKILEQNTQMPLEIGASGTFNLKVIDARKLLIKVLGTDSQLNVNDLLNKSNVGLFKGLVVTKVKMILSKLFIDKKYNIFSIDEHLDEMSDSIKEELNKELDNYGLTLPEFYVTNIATPDDDANFIRLKNQCIEKSLNVNLGE